MTTASHQHGADKDWDNGSRDRVLSRTMIVEHVWNQSFEGLTNIVDFYVRQLRKKIDDDHEKKLLRTVRGVGYSITEDEA